MAAPKELEVIKESEKLFNLPFEEYRYFSLNSDNCSWAKEISNELNDFDPDEKELAPKETAVHFKIQIKKDENKNLNEYVLLKGELKGSYYTSCIKCLMPAFHHFETTVQECFINSSLEDSPEFEDLDSVLVENEEFDIHFIEDKIVPIKQSVWEQIVISLNPYPTHSDDCKGLCLHCGTNLNLNKCKHQKS